MPAERDDILVGSTLGKEYRVLQPIGTGGMAVVYLVEHETLLKRFAAKVLSAELASSEDARARFTQEAHAASQLDHENIVTISDFGVTADHRPFFVMELLRGQTLDERLVDGPMTIEEVVAVAVPVARALAHAHAEGIVHRDVKPENIFLVQRSQGRWGVKVVDFGIAKTPINAGATESETLGSPLFMAPEMIRGEDDVDQRADVYSFGVLLYLMLCGRLPFFDENLRKVMQMHLSLPVPSPRSVNPALSVELAAILDRALAKHPDDRYPSMDALLVDLEAALPAGSDRLLIEAQSGAARGETPFAATLAMPRTESQRSIRTSEALRTMRVEPLPSPFEEPRLPPLRSSGPNRAVIVLGSALISGAIGVVAYRLIASTGHRGTIAAATVPHHAGATSVSPRAEHAAAAAAGATPTSAPATPPSAADPASPTNAPPAASPTGPIADAAHARTGSTSTGPIADAAHARVGSTSTGPIADAAHARVGSTSTGPIVDAAHARVGSASTGPIVDAAHARVGSASTGPVVDAAHARVGSGSSAPVADTARARAGAGSSAPVADTARARAGAGSSAPVADATHGRAGAGAAAGAAGDAARAAPIATTSPATTKRPAVRPKPPVRREPPRPAKRVAAVTPPAAAARPATAAPPAPPPVESEPPAAATPPAPTEPPAAEHDPPAAQEPSPPQPSPPPPQQPQQPPQQPPAAAPPPPKPVAPSKPAGPGSLDAVPAVATLEVKGSLSPAVVRRSVERSLGSLRSCYQAAARAGNATPAVDLQVRFEIDENSMATHVTTSGTGFGSLASCAASVVGQLHTQEAPDVGTAQVSVLIRFRPS